MVEDFGARFLAALQERREVTTDPLVGKLCAALAEILEEVQDPAGSAKKKLELLKYHCCLYRRGNAPRVVNSDEEERASLVDGWKHSPPKVQCEAPKVMRHASGLEVMVQDDQQERAFKPEGWEDLHSIR